ncbi:MAG: hypothetical protein J6P67_00830 [Bacteroidaceae bacterium]|nr:hypothetical protein [Bacteroidaceae bacterium]
MEQNQFDALAYFEELGKKNKLAKANNFKVDYCSGPGALELMMQEYRDAQNFIFIDDTTSGNTFSNKVGWFDKNVYKVFIIAGYDYGDADSYNQALQICRKIFQQMLSRVIRDKESYKYGDKLMYLNTQSIYSSEFGRYSFNGATGLYFMVENLESLDLIYDDSEWEHTQND